MADAWLRAGAVGCVFGAQRDAEVEVDMRHRWTGAAEEKGLGLWFCVYDAHADALM